MWSCCAASIQIHLTHTVTLLVSSSSSSLLRTVFSEAARAGKRFRVIVADGRPRFEGRAMARHMVSAGIECSYIQVRRTLT